MPEKILQEVHDDGSVRLEFDLHAYEDGHRALVRVTGKGTMDGAHAMVSFLDKAIGVTGAAPTAAMMLLGGAESTPIRAQFLLSKWLLKNKSRVGPVSVVGARPWERKLATAVVTIAGFKNLAFHHTEAEGRAWLGWTDRRP